MNIAIPRPHLKPIRLRETLLGFFKAQPVLVIAFILAVISAVIVPPDAKYRDYCNTTVLIQLFGLMIAVSGVRSIGVFDAVTGVILKRTGTVRRLGLMLMLLCFFTSMIATNDVVLLTFVPLTLLMFRQIPDEKSRILTVVLETAAANLGSMLTPVGNPQNLYLYDHYAMTGADFLRVMLPAGAASLVMLCLLCLLLPKTACSAASQKSPAIHKGKAAVYTALFAVCLCCVFRMIPPLALLFTAIAAALLFDRSLLKKVDYSLLVTFVCFFVFVGNIARIPAVSEGISQMLSGREVLVSAILSQGISNVPAAMMLSGFTENGSALLLGVNLGGLGTMIASMASLISFQFYRKTEGAKAGRYFAVFSAVNFGMLAVLLIGAQLLG